MHQKLPRCILHIGTPKTGSTAIQHFLEKNYNNLKERNILADVPLAIKLSRALTGWESREFFLKKVGISNPNQHANFRVKAYEQLQRVLNEPNNLNNTVIFSSEHFYELGCDPVKIERLQLCLEQYFEVVEVLCYFRDPVDLVVSNYSQALKGKFAGSLQTYIGWWMKQWDWNYFSQYQIWSSIFGADRCRFVPFNPKKQVSYDVVLDFCSRTDLDLADLTLFKGSRINPQLSVRMIAALRLINTLVPLFVSMGKGRELVLNPLNRKLKKYVMDHRILSAGRKLKLSARQKHMVRLTTHREYTQILEHSSAYLEDQAE
ncbi:hypothetical protein N9O95_04790 [Alphaproteobacteria bacterium]|nr:hypothetical protein [Alphaproteobacteria bacterium]